VLLHCNEVKWAEMLLLLVIKCVTSIWFYCTPTSYYIVTLWPGCTWWCYMSWFSINSYLIRLFRTPSFKISWPEPKTLHFCHWNTNTSPSPHLYASVFKNKIFSIILYSTVNFNDPIKKKQLRSSKKYPWVHYYW
jgi:hypothetical protein